MHAVGTMENQDHTHIRREMNEAGSAPHMPSRVKRNGTSSVARIFVKGNHGGRSLRRSEQLMTGIPCRTAKFYARDGQFTVHVY